MELTNKQWEEALYKAHVVTKKMYYIQRNSKFIPIRQENENDCHFALIKDGKGHHMAVF